MIDALIRRFDEYPQSDFIITDTAAHSYRDLKRRIAEVGAELDEHRMGSSAFVLLAGDFSLTSIAALLALASRGATIAPLGRSGAERLAPQTCKLEPDFLIDTTEASSLSVRALHRHAPSPLASVVPHGQPGLVVFTSGSTGTPKAIVHEFRPLLEKFRRKRYPHRAIPFLLFDHLGGINTILSLATSGGCIVQTRSRGIGEICAAIEKYRISLLPTTPTFLNLLLASGEFRNFDHSSLKVVTYGTEVMNESVLRKLVDVFPGVEFKQTYGMSEFGVLATSSKSSDSTWVRVGGEGVETKIVEGILWVKARSRMLGHFDFSGGEPVWMPPTDDWFCTEDVVLQDGDYLKFMGRKSDIINVSGLKVFPSEVENCLLACPIVKDAYVRGDPNLLTGEMISAHVVLRGPMEKGLARMEVEEFCRQRLERFKVPSKIIFLDAVNVSDRFKKIRGA